MLTRAAFACGGGLDNEWAEHAAAGVHAFAASLVAASKLVGSKAGMVWILPSPWLAYQIENASIASAFGASTMSTKS